VRQSIEALLTSGAPAAPQDVAALFGEVGKAATEKIIDELVNRLVGLQPQVLEDLISKMISARWLWILRTNQFDSKGGDADIVARAELSPLATVFEQQSILLIQVKKKTGIDNDDVTAVKQLVQMADIYPGATMVVISTAQGFTEACVSAAKDSHVALIAGRTLARLLLRHMP
jgi:hypothetical protein